MIESSVLKKLGVFAGGVLFGTAGIKVLSSKDAKKVYTGCTAAVLRAQENAEDILAEAKQINEERAKKEEEVFEDEACCCESETETTEAE